MAHLMRRFSPATLELTPSIVLVRTRFVMASPAARRPEPVDVRAGHLLCDRRQRPVSLAVKVESMAIGQDHDPDRAAFVFLDDGGTGRRNPAVTVFNPSDRAGRCTAGSGLGRADGCLRGHHSDLRKVGQFCRPSPSPLAEAALRVGLDPPRDLADQVRAVASAALMPVQFLVPHREVSGRHLA